MECRGEVTEKSKACGHQGWARESLTCQDSKKKAGKGYICCSLQIHVGTKRECCGERKSASEEEALSALSCSLSLTPLILELDQNMKERLDHPKSRA